jgi:hypothetical protein
MLHSLVFGDLCRFRCWVVAESLFPQEIIGGLTYCFLVFAIKVLATAFILLLLSSVTTGTHYFIVSASEPEIMSFEEAVQAVNKNDVDSWHKGYTYTGKPNQTRFGDTSEVSGFFMWLAPNGTFYEAEYPDRNVLGEIGFMQGELSWNPPDGYFIWNLANNSGLTGYWMLANNGTIVRIQPLRGSGPVLPLSEIVTRGLTAAIILVVAGVGLILLNRNQKTKHKST